MSQTVRLCMISAGGHSSRNVHPCFAFLKGAEVVANCDLDLEKAKGLARRHGIPRSYSDYHEMLESEGPDGVMVCVSDDFHARVGMELMEMGYHVYTEKPPAASLDQCRQVVEVHRRTGKICMTGLKKRYAPAYARAKEIMESEDFGQPMLFQLLRTSGSARSNYILRGQIHVTDLVHYFFGPVRRVTAYKHPLNTSAIALEFANGAVGNLALTDNLKGRRKWEQVTIIGDGSVCIQIDNSVEMIAFKEGKPFAAHKPDFTTGGSHSSVEMGFVGELQEFADCIREGRTPRSSIEFSYHGMCLVEGILKSLETDKAVLLEQL